MPVDPAELPPLGELPAFAERFERAGYAAGFAVERYGEIEGCPLIALTKRSRGVRPRIYLSSGIHGDEPAPPLALLSLLESGLLDDRATWFVVPLLNPSGLRRGLRENADGLDLNRDYKDLQSPEIRAHVRWLGRQPNFTVMLAVHEDWESTGYYLYELNPTGRRSLAEPMIGAVAPICPIDHSPLIDGRESKAGILRPVADPLLREKWPESIYLRAHHTTLTYTIESPSAFPLPQRIAAHRRAIETAIGLTVEEFRAPRQAAMP
ncbi:MAG: hypothetical protein JWM88_507 [Verrucomicrobia bacterium]|nr:hypothetical protein [Verrucomicrobiota bacterium]